jgi:hypothetical protein
LSDQAIACQDMNKIKQIDTRTKKLSGLFNSIFSIVYSTVIAYIMPGSTEN